MKKEEKITEAMKDIKFVEKIIDIRSPEEMQKAFATKKIDLSLEEAQAVISTIKKLSESKSGEVSDEDLEEISGGATSSTNSIIPFVVIGGLMTAIVVGDSVNKVDSHNVYFLSCVLCCGELSSAGCSACSPCLIVALL